MFAQLASERLSIHTKSNQSTLTIFLFLQLSKSRKEAFVDWMKNHKVKIYLFFPRSVQKKEPRLHFMMNSLQYVYAQWKTKPKVWCSGEFNLIPFFLLNIEKRRIQQRRIRTRD
jgi:hypothetical protein